MSGLAAVTGATGFVGGHIVTTLANRGWTVRALVRRPGAMADRQDVVLVHGSLSNGESLAELVHGTDAVIHCAGLIRGASDDDFEAANVTGTARLADAVARAPRPPRFVLMSSLAARAPATSPYAASKRSAERLLAARKDDLPWLALRPPTVYGPGDRATLAIFRQLKWRLAAIPRVENARLSLIYVEDLADAVAEILAQDGLTDAVFEVHDGCEEGYTWRMIVDNAARQLGTAIVPLRVPRSVMDGVAAINTGHAKLTGRAPMITPGKVRELYHADWVCRDNPLVTVTGWRPRVAMNEGFRRTLGWYREAGWL